ncbi:TAXI family TRAP transporter solute-binding subunit, partial [Azospirillum brasilense]|nr:TAXI family TRAP transporter solute-binding subunit [Azospirillum brasilense]
HTTHLPWGVAAQNHRYFRIGAGSPSCTYGPIGVLLPDAIATPPGSRPSHLGGSCGVPGMIPVAQATLGSVENIELLRSGAVEAGMSQADIAYWAYTGSGIFHGKAPFEGLRSIGMLYAEAIQLVVRADSDLPGGGRLGGPGVSVGRRGPRVRGVGGGAPGAVGGEGAGLRPPAYLKPGPAADRLARRELDAFFMVGGFPVAAVTDVANREPIRLIPLDGEVADGLRIRQRFYMDQTIPADTYPGVPEIHTLGVGAELLVRADRDPALIHGVTKALWHENTRRLLIEGHPKGRSFDATKAVANVSVPLHPGAERYYREVGLIGNAANEPTGGATP